MNPHGSGEEMWREKWPGLPAAELAGPWSILKGFLRTEGRGSACSIRVAWTSLYTEATRPITGAGTDLPADKSPFETKVADIVRPKTHPTLWLWDLISVRCDWERKRESIKLSLTGTVAYISLWLKRVRMSFECWTLRRKYSCSLALLSSGVILGKMIKIMR